MNVLAQPGQMTENRQGTRDDRQDPIHDSRLEITNNRQTLYSMNGDYNGGQTTDDRQGTTENRHNPIHSRLEITLYNRCRKTLYIMNGEDNWARRQTRDDRKQTRSYTFKTGDYRQEKIDDRQET